MLYAAHECARIVLEEGLQNAVARHARASKALVSASAPMSTKRSGAPRYAS
jgi:aspartate aminotransferase-like enzyme